MNRRTNYRHKDLSNNDVDLPVGKVVCIGRNYMAHIHELNNEVPEQPLYFMKHSDSLVDLSQPVDFPRHLGSCHHELEIAVLINQRLTSADEEQAKQAIWGYGLALDLTLRDLQTQLKKKGQPWERAKAFDGSCPISSFVAVSDVQSQPMTFSLSVNGQVRQDGNTANMMLKIDELIADISHLFTLNPGDIVLTGTPEGVAELKGGDGLLLTLDNYFSVETLVSKRDSDD